MAGELLNHKEQETRVLESSEHLHDKGNGALVTQELLCLEFASAVTV